MWSLRAGQSLGAEKPSFGQALFTSVKSTHIRHLQPLLPKTTLNATPGIGLLDESGVQEPLHFFPDGDQLLDGVVFRR
ncbi:hypothetical protein Nepgr_002042 [Nepenthes gracilis]|uniref:Uncharacterized protein n=1 Tax=Nepenthes gracilis TaxID=150966 RepID=A0AAD3P893_NEPGR|nr:hypothetical protein Nepgr_002042 [Nepenthes gracilis]